MNHCKMLRIGVSEHSTTRASRADPGGAGSLPARKDSCDWATTSVAGSLRISRTRRQAMRLAPSPWAETAVRNSLRTSSVVTSEVSERSAVRAASDHSSPGMKTASLTSWAFRRRSGRSGSTVFRKIAQFFFGDHAAEGLRDARHLRRRGLFDRDTGPTAQHGVLPHYPFRRLAVISHRPAARR
jgi:hypothetical protein